MNLHLPPTEDILRTVYPKIILPGRMNGVWPVPNISETLKDIGGGVTRTIKAPHLLGDWRKNDFDYVMDSLPGAEIFDLICYSDSCQVGYPAARHPYCRSLVFISGFYNPEWKDLRFNVPSLFITSDGEKNKLRGGTTSAYLAATANYCHQDQFLPIFRYLPKDEKARFPHLTTPARSIPTIEAFYRNLDRGVLPLTPNNGCDTALNVHKEIFLKSSENPYS